MIFDEAHELEDVASSYFGIGLSNVRFEELARDVETLLRAQGGLKAEVVTAAQMIRERARLFFGALPMRMNLRGAGMENGREYGRATQGGEGRMPFTNREEFLETQGDVYLGVLNALRRMEGELEQLKAEEAQPLRRRTGMVREQLKFLMESEDRNTVFWLERRQRAANAVPHLQATPIDVSELLRELLFENYPSVVLTSATLTVQGGFAHIRKRLGLDEGAGTGGAVALSICAAGAAVSAAGDARSARAGFSGSGGATDPADAGDHAGTGVLPVHELQPDARAA